MSFNISYVYTAIDKFSPTSRSIGKSLDRLKQKILDNKDAFRKLAAASVKAGKSMVAFGKNAFKKVSLPILAVAGVALKASADFETLRISFDTMLGSAAKGKKLFDDLVNFSTATPFQLKDIGGSAQTAISCWCRRR